MSWKAEEVTGTYSFVWLYCQKFVLNKYPDLSSRHRIFFVPPIHFIAPPKYTKLKQEIPLRSIWFLLTPVHNEEHPAHLRNLLAVTHTHITSMDSRHDRSQILVRQLYCEFRKKF